MDRDKRNFLSGTAALAVAGLAELAHGRTRATAEVFTPEMFGAKGDGTTNDSDAFAALAAEVNANGGGVVRLRRRTYLVGAQERNDGRFAEAFRPKPLLHLRGCTKRLTIEGNGAAMKCAPGLRFGTFDPSSGEPTRNAMPYLDKSQWSSPYEYMIMVEACAGTVEIADLELDGNLAALRIGGPFGDTGWQISATGLYLVDNRGDEIVRNVHSHHHPQDGLMINGLDDEALAGRVRRRIENFRSEYNGRQGCSIIGGHGYAFRGCKFNHTGRGGLVSAPAAGVDIEAEGGKTNRDHRFVDCEFSDNDGCAMVADSGDSEGATFTGCTFVGTTNWSVWPYKPYFRFEGCTIVGTAVKCFGDPDPARAAQFHDCTFRDDPALSPNGKVYLSGRPDGPIADLSDAENVLFERCAFLLDHGAVLPWSTRAIYSNCRMRQTSGTNAFPRGAYRGRNVVDGAVILNGTTVDGDLILNGKPVSD
ncbi:right-handed parallel beta-helix repeat-containing protein [Sphingosinicella rhizophila]|uniref:Right handed beta helix domain-containing protein n=1 Tax=Sphingosinicella rhizophila TaxID=3050082 RepID=A0ABU3QBL7_9SPHN|nr:right-handed parallel beta-helix repeat-containing protein [Sphingosinicella sp. GR2756]MDT9600800.1 hypothetical protein [Sphingosinicella sp. GR2756]